MNGRPSFSVALVGRAGAGPLCVPVALVGQVGARESTGDNQLRVAPVDCLLPPAAPGTLGPVILDPAVYTRSPPPAPPPPRPDRAATETRTYIAWTNSSTLASFPSLPPLHLSLSLLLPLAADAHARTHAYATNDLRQTDTRYLDLPPRLRLTLRPSSSRSNILPLIFTYGQLNDFFVELLEWPLSKRTVASTRATRPANGVQTANLWTVGGSVDLLRLISCERRASTRA